MVRGPVSAQGMAVESNGLLALFSHSVDLLLSLHLGNFHLELELLLALFEA